ncbi:hypothetical protein [Oceanobacillus sp. CF4.6]|uniref:hypothetical protein n=1 Tax=Oceanobacillus sp. CF4.6 TaxID=3373080 RepID=UPI003EE62C79
MELKELIKHSNAIIKAEKAGVEHMWGNEIILSSDLFLEMVTKYKLPTEESTSADSGNYHLSFGLNGIEYYTIVSAEEHAERFQENKKMTS